MKNQIQYAILNTPLQILFTRLFFFILNSSIILIIPSITSFKLCGGIFVAIPTAIPDEPFIKSVGILVGNTVGSCSLSS